MGLRFLTQLRVDLNPLRKYKFHHIFADTCDELCPDGDGIEDIFHYFLDCHRYVCIRITLLDNVSDLIGANIHNFSRKTIASLLLYGNKAFQYNVNKAILNATINYIHKSEKFKST